jgi:ABC-type transport system involved in multi-copper enzyme maturation permease subunit
MTLLPVVERELRAESRGTFTYWLRVGGGVALLGAGAVFLTGSSLRLNMGGELFRMMHVTLFIAVWVVAALMTADSISRERREGTLGLLFLTPLRPLDVVLAKSFAHGLRAAGMGLAAVPVMVVPFLMGGVGWREALASVLINFSALCWGLAAGVLASSRCKSLNRSLVVTVLAAIVSLVVLLTLHGAAVLAAVSPVGGRGRPFHVSLSEVPLYGAQAVSRPDLMIEWAGRWRGLPTGTGELWLWMLGVVAAASLAICFILLLIAALNVRHSIRDKTHSVAMQRVEKEFCTPTFALGFYRKWMQRILTKNPVGWLERRTWQGRLVTWSWLAVMISLLSWMLAGVGGYNRGEFNGVLTTLGWLLVGNVALTAAGSLRRERESGVIELLLVSPLSPEQIIGGRLRGISGQFLPAAVLLFGSWLWLLHAFKGVFLEDRHIARGLVELWMFVITLLTLPVAGLYFSLRCRMFIVALFWTAVMAVALPWLAAFASVMLAWQISNAEMLLPWKLRFIVSFLAAAGAAVIWRRRASGIRSLMIGFALTLAACAVLMLALGIHWEFLEPVIAISTVTVLCSTLQLGLGAWLAVLLRQRLARREFALPQ